MRFTGAIAALLVVALLAGGSAGAQPPDEAVYAEAIASATRTERDRAADPDRKPEGFLRFAEVRPGSTVVEINAGAGYLARLLPGAVGPDGHVYATNADWVQTLFDGIQNRLQASLLGAENVTVLAQRDDRLTLPVSVDIAILNNNYHDLHWQGIDLDRWNRSIYAALKPGGLYIVGDHVAAGGRGVADVSTLHRIEPSVVVHEVQAAGFEWVGQSTLYANDADDGTTMVMDPPVRGRTNRFLYKFRRPR